MNEDIFEHESKVIAEMLGETIEEYKASLKSLKRPKFNKKSSDFTKDDSILKELGLTENDLKKKR